MAQPLSVGDLQKLIITCSSCLALLILVMGTLYGVITGAISPDHLGSVKSLGVGGGLLGFGSIIALIIKMSIGGGRNQ